MMAADTDRALFSVRQARRLVGDLFTPNPAIVWGDFLASWLAGVVCFQLVPAAPAWWPDAPREFAWGLQAGLATASCLLLYRASMFIHELAHLRGVEFRWFRLAWNLLCGVPCLTPSMLYHTHLEHHRVRHYGTEHDGEYVPFAHAAPWNAAALLLVPWLAPPLAVVRFLALAPLGWCFPAWHAWIVRRASSLVIHADYVRPLPDDDEWWTIRWQEALCCAWCAGLLGAALVAPELMLPRLWQGYFTGVAILTLNNLRTLGAHRWDSRGEHRTLQEQVLDSVNYPHGGWWTELWAPVGTRYHALHHLFPTLPYHNLAEAHRRLMEGLPADSPYRQTEAPSLAAVLAELWRRSLAAWNAGAPPAAINDAATVPQGVPFPAVLPWTGAQQPTDTGPLPHVVRKAG